ncbi:MAG TPA: GNAT family N-acetyltransferase [Polyangiales bacterium]|nr:GNAT family N-acetyltransferase [Polyangiales bacterium]
MDTLEVRSAAATDLPSLLQLNALVQAQHATAYPELFLAPSDTDLRAHFERVLSDREYRVRVAARTGVCVGYTVSRIERRPANAFRRAYEALFLHEICVATSCRGTGIGTALMHDLEAAASGVGMLILDTWAFNLEAQRFFERRGFSPQRTTLWRRLQP